MKSNAVGKSTSRPEITNISSNGIWVLFNEKENFLPFDDYPWFKNATIAQIQNVRVLHGSHLYWPDLDIDLSREIIENLEAYPLVWR